MSWEKINKLKAFVARIEAREAEESAHKSVLKMEKITTDIYNIGINESVKEVLLNHQYYQEEKKCNIAAQRAARERIKSEHYKSISMTYFNQLMSDIFVWEYKNSYKSLEDEFRLGGLT